MGPARKDTQVELSQTDARQLGINAPLRESGDVQGTPGCIIIGPKGPLVINQGCTLPKPMFISIYEDAKRMNIKDKDKIDLLVKGQRTVCFCDVLARVGDTMKLISTWIPMRLMPLWLKTVIWHISLTGLRFDTLDLFKCKKSRSGAFSYLTSAFSLNKRVMA